MYRNQSQSAANTILKTITTDNLVPVQVNEHISETPNNTSVLIDK